jgi:hypothetical protein
LRRWCACSYLTLDIYFPKGSGTKSLEKGRSLPNLHSIGLFDDGLRTVGHEEFTTDVIVVEAKLVSEEAERDVSIPVFVSFVTAQRRRDPEV